MTLMTFEQAVAECDKLIEPGKNVLCDMHWHTEPGRDQVTEMTYAPEFPVFFGCHPFNSTVDGYDNPRTTTEYRGQPE